MAWLVRDDAPSLSFAPPALLAVLDYGAEAIPENDQPLEAEGSTACPLPSSRLWMRSRNGVPRGVDTRPWLWILASGRVELSLRSPSQLLVPLLFILSFSMIKIKTHPEVMRGMIMSYIFASSSAAVPSKYFRA